MPELPEVETTRRGVAPHVEGRTIRAVRVRDARLRWPIADSFGQDLTGRTIVQVDRRAKYLLFRTEPAGGDGSMGAPATIMVHLGMSGSLRIATPDAAVGDHDHVDFELDAGAILR